MKYHKFIIQDYKAISGQLEIDVARKTLLPIIGINESGKTSILWSLFAFDEYNDSLNDGRHLEKVSNLYKTTDRGEPSVVAEIEITSDELKSILKQVKADNEVLPEHKTQLKKYSKPLKNWGGVIRIKRNLETKTYSIENPELLSLKEINIHVADYILSKTPFVLYFDDFRDTVDEKIEIVQEGSSKKGWLTTIEKLFGRTNRDYSVYKLQGMEELTRKVYLLMSVKLLTAHLQGNGRSSRLKKEPGWMSKYNTLIKEGVRS